MKLVFDHTKSFQVYSKTDKHRQFPTEWFYVANLSNDEVSHYASYDANLWPCPDIVTWNPNYIKEECTIISKMFKGDKRIYLDGHLLDKDKAELIITDQDI